MDDACMPADTHAKASVEGKEDGEFSIMDGSIRGQFVTLKAFSKIVMKWKVRPVFWC